MLGVLAEELGILDSMIGIGGIGRSANWISLYPGFIGAGYG